MTKGKNERRHIQNRAWEKDRRDRLNTTFENLAKLLPEYQPKVTFSKIEILLKTIVYIEDLRKKLRDVLSTQNESILKTQEELEESLKLLVSQNNNLVELLKKSNIKVPHFVGPKFLSYIVSVHDAEPSESCDEKEKSQKNENKLATSDEFNQKQSYQSPQTKSNVKSNEVIQSPIQINKESYGNKIVNQPENYDPKSLPKSQLNILPEIKEVQSFGSVDLIPVTTDSTRSELKVHEKPVKNFVEITPLLNNHNDKVPTQPEKTCDLPPLKESSNIQESKSEKRSLDVSVIVSTAQSSVNSKIAKTEKSNENVSVVEKPKNTLKASSNEVRAIPHCDKKSTTKKQNVQERKIVPLKVQTTNIGQSKSAKVSKPLPVCSAARQSKSLMNSPIKSINNAIAPTNSERICGKKVENLELPKELSVNISNEKDLPDELFGSFPLPQTPNSSNPNALSPTAAFLLSFPVVSTVSSSKPTETDNSYSEGTNLLRLEEKQNQPKDHSLFESISSILNDLNDVSDNSKTISNVDNSGSQFPYCINKNRSNIDHERSNVLNDIGANRSKPSQKNLNINNLLSDDRMRSSHSGRVELPKSSTNETKKQPIAECLTNSMQSNNLLNERTNYMPPKTYENVPNPSDNTSDFYVSLSTLGLPMKSASTLASTPINPSSHFNFQISSLAQPRNLIDSRPLIADTPFTFSLTKCSDTITNTMSSTTKVTSYQQQDDQTIAHRTNKTQKKTSPTKHLVNDRFVVPTEPTLTPLNRCNSFNPFSFDNTPMLSSSSSIALGNLTTVSSSNSSIGTPFTFTLTPTFSSISASTPLLSNHDPLFSSSFDMPIMRSTNASTKNSKKDKPSIPFCGDRDQTQLTSGKNTKNFITSSSIQTKPSKNLVNWMTSSVNRPTTQELHLDFISSANEEPSAWSPNRIAVDNTNLISSSALPMLQGDLALNTISNTCNPSVNKFDIDAKKLSIRTNNSSQKYSQLKLSTNRKSEQNLNLDRSVKGGKSDKNLHTFKNHHQSTSIRMNEPNPITNNFHSVSQLLDQERQTANKNSCYIPNEGKMLLKDPNSSIGGSGSGNSVVTKQKLYSKYEPDPSNQLIENKFPTNVCNVVGSSDITSSECDRDLFGGYFFSQPKRLKLNYHSSSEFLGNQSFPSTYENSTTNDILAPYTTNYQTFDSDCNNVSASSCINNLSNQTYSYQYTQPQSYNHQPQQQPQNACDPIESTNYFQAPAPLPSYKPPHFNEMVRSNAKTSAQQSFLHQTTTKTTNDTITTNAKLFSCPPSSSATPNISTQLPMGTINRNSTACPSKTIHYPSHTNINNLPLNQAWNDSFTWMPYTNSIDKPYNNNLFNSNSESTSNKTVTTNNISGNNNTIPNFNLTTIFPDYNKS